MRNVLLFLESYSLTVIRLPNNEVMRNFRGVCEYVDDAVRQSLSQKSKDFWQLPLHKGALGAPAPVRKTWIWRADYIRDFENENWTNKLNRR